MELSYISLPFQLESFSSVMLRLAWKNGYRNLQQLFYSYEIGNGGIVSNQWVGSKLYKTLMCQKPINDDVRSILKPLFRSKLMYHRTDVFNTNGCSIPTSTLRTNLAICTKCVAEGYLDHMHSYEFCDTCPKHSEFYIEKCPSCGNKFEWLTLEKEFSCPCGFSPKNLKPDTVDSYTSRLVSNAIVNSDSIYLSNLFAALRCSVSLQNILGNHERLVDCQNIATEDKNYFFGFIRKIQRIFPSMHRKAILSPWLISNNSTFRTYAIEYLFSASQVKPNPHTKNCPCGSLLYSKQEINYILNLKSRNSDSIKSNYKSKIGKLYTVKDLCTRLISMKNVKWETADCLPSPTNENRLLSATEAANALHTSKSTIQHLHNHGLLKGDNFNRKTGLLIPVRELELFQSQYILNREISAILHLRPASTNALLTSMGAKKADCAGFSRGLIAYKRESIPAEILTLLLKLKFNPKPASNYTPRSGVNFIDAAAKLALDPKDMGALVEMGLLKTTQSIRRTGTLGRLLCTKESLHQTMLWRERLLTFTEASRVTGCSTKLLHSRFIAGEYAKEIRLNCTSLMSRRDAEKIRKHFSLYTTMVTAKSEYCVRSQTIDKLIKDGKILPLRKSHKHYLKSQVTLTRTELDNIFMATGAE